MDNEGKVFKNFKEVSKGNLGRYLPKDKNISLEEAQLGAILRIAEATEVMAQNYNNLLASNKSLTNSNNYLRNRNKDLELQIRGHKAAYTRLKRKMEQIKIASSSHIDKEPSK